MTTNEFTKHEVGDGFFWKCNTCGAIIKQESNLEKHLHSPTHKNYNINKFFWNQKKRQYNPEPFVSLLKPISQPSK